MKKNFFKRISALTMCAALLMTAPIYAAGEVDHHNGNDGDGGTVIEQPGTGDSETGYPEDGDPGSVQPFNILRPDQY